MAQLFRSDRPAAELCDAVVNEGILCSFKLTIVLYEATPCCCLVSFWHHSADLTHFLVTKLNGSALRTGSVKADVLEWVQLFHAHVDVELSYPNVLRTQHVIRSFK